MSQAKALGLVNLLQATPLAEPGAPCTDGKAGARLDRRSAITARKVRCDTGKDVKSLRPFLCVLSRRATQVSMVPKVDCA